MRDVEGQPIANTVDTHVWLDPNNAVRIGFFIAALRSKQHPEYKTEYWANAKNFAQQLLIKSKQVGAYKNTIQYWSYHDAYQYLERALNLSDESAQAEALRARLGEGPAADAAALGTELADRLLAAGGLEVLHELGLLLDR